MTWDHPFTHGESPIREYKLTYGLQGSLDRKEDTIDQSENSVTIDNLIPGRVYEFTIVAINRVGESPASILYSYTALQVPDSPLNFVLEQERIDNDHYIVVTWDDPAFSGGAPILAYRVMFDDGDNGSFLAPVHVTLSTQYNMLVPHSKLGSVYRF